ncbi:hypothetical protein K438DRAFT_191867 [Mycena galopus ATCC 62051]|nr:hypothetical protein K438DRAFT_191867 [Mycena galopus ATCC 62051]
MEDNWDSSLLNYIRTSGCGGPFAWMLSPTKPALANFGRYNESVVVNMAQNLAEASGFPVVIRPATDNPALTLLTRDTDSHVEYAHSNNTGGDNAERSNDREDENEDMLVDERPPGDSDNNRRGDNDLGDAEMDGQGLHAAEEYKTNQISTALGPDGGGGGGDGAGPTEVDGKWASPLHRTRVKLDLKVNAADPYAVSLGYTLKFIINRETEIPIDLNDLSRPLSQSEVIALVDLKIETRPRETQVDRSYANIGFVAHRQHSIIEREFLHRGFDLPDKVYKRGQQRQIQGGIQGAVGFSQGSPLATATFAHGRNKGTTLEATDSKVLPRCRMDYETGKEWDKDNKSFSSYNIVYQAQDIQLDGERPDFRPLEVKVGMGINLRPAVSCPPI